MAAESVACLPACPWDLLGITAKPESSRSIVVLGFSREKEGGGFPEIFWIDPTHYLGWPFNHQSVPSSSPPHHHFPQFHLPPFPFPALGKTTTATAPAAPPACPSVGRTGRSQSTSGVFTKSPSLPPPPPPPPSVQSVSFTEEEIPVSFEFRVAAAVHFHKFHFSSTSTHLKESTSGSSSLRPSSVHS